jgi:hypothetical protein
VLGWSGSTRVHPVRIILVPAPALMRSKAEAAFSAESHSRTTTEIERNWAIPASDETGVASSKLIIPSAMSVPPGIEERHTGA